jgi:hypothetical protein
MMELREIPADDGNGWVTLPDVETDLIIQRAMSSLDRNDQIKLAGVVAVCTRQPEMLSALRNSFMKYCGFPLLTRGISTACQGHL